MGFVEAVFSSGNAIRITDGIPLQLGKLSWCDGCDSYKPSDFGQTVSDESQTISLLWICAECYTPLLGAMQT